MKRLTGLVAAVVLMGPMVAAQEVSNIKPSPPAVGGSLDSTRLYTRPGVPSPEALARLNLNLAWRTYIDTDGKRDGLLSVQILGDQILVQTLKGLVTAVDASNGTTLWRNNPGHSYRAHYPAGYNASTIFIIRGINLYALDRRTGQEQWTFELPDAATAPPAADNKRLYVALNSLNGGRLMVYDLPLQAAPPPSAVKPKAPGSPAKANPEYTGREMQEGTAGERQLQFSFDFQTQTGLEQAPLLTQAIVVMAGTDGSFFATSQFERKLLYRFQTDASLSAPLAQYGNMAYIASQDFNVYAMNIVAGRIVWRFTGGSPILRKVAVNDDNVYVTPDRGGLYCLDRGTDRAGGQGGEVKWHNLRAAYFLAANKKFVYAYDDSSRLLILDQATGTQLAIYDTHDYVVPVSNELTDRLFLAANDGLLICLHDRAYPTALPMKTVQEKPAQEAKPEGK